MNNANTSSQIPDQVDELLLANFLDATIEILEDPNTPEEIKNALIEVLFTHESLLIH